MLRFCTIAIAIAFMMLPALAQQQSSFEPYTITEQGHQALLFYLGDVPAKYANPIINQLVQMEQQAMQKRAAADAIVKEDKAKNPK
jgi:hypothetical protein